MTEIQWMLDDSPSLLVGHVQKEAGVRKLQILAVECCRKVIERWQVQMDDPHGVFSICLPLLEVAERLTDDQASEDEQRDAINKVRKVQPRHFSRASYDWNLSQLCSRVIGLLSIRKFDNPIWAGGTPTPGRRRIARLDRFDDEPVEVRRWQSALIREVIGNPFRPITIDPRWLTSNVVDLSRAIYDERAFEKMPILADALMDAGCDSEEIIAHCRSDRPHVRGCWVVDLLLGKE